MKKRLTCAVILGLTIASPFSASAGQIVDSGAIKPDAEIIVGGEVVSKDLSNVIVTGKSYGVFAYGEGILDATGNDNINISVTNENGNADGVAASTLSNGEKEPNTKYTHGGTINLGSDKTGNINITVNAKSAATGIGVIRAINDKNVEPSFVNVKGKNLEINVHSNNGYAAGVWVQNNTGNPENPSTLKIDVENIKITSTANNTQMESGEYYNLGLVNYSSGKLIVNGNLTIDAGTAISTRGNAQTIINAANDKTVQIKGDINFNYDKPSSGTAVDATVDINLSNANSYLDGNIFVNGNPFPPSGKEDVSAMQLGLANGAQWTTDDDSFVNKLNLNGGIINIEGGEGHNVQIDEINGNGGIVNIKTTIEEDNFDAGTITIDKGVEESGKARKLDVNFTGITADNFADKEASAAALNKLAENVKVNDENIFEYATANIKEGILSGAVSGDMTFNTTNGEGNVDIQDVQQNQSTSTMENMRDVASVALVAWRQEDSTLSQRLGELRNSEGDQGIWTRMSRGEFEYGGAFKNQYNYFQIGYDKAYGDWHYGAAISHNDGKTTYAAGNGENRSTSLSLYGTWLGEKGNYVDVVLKQGRLSNEFTNYADAGKTTGDYDAWGTSLSAEYGQKVAMQNDWYVTPQAQLTYMRIGGEDYTANVDGKAMQVSQDTLQSFVGRVGFELGKNVSDKGSVYVKASLLHEFAGDADTYLRMGDLSNSYKQDLSDTWYECGLGVNYKTSANSYVYADVVKTFGGDVETPWQWNAGMRWSF